MKTLLPLLPVLAGLLSAAPAAAKNITLLNVSYDPTRELDHDFNGAFSKFWKGKTGDDVLVNHSHGGSGKQAPTFHQLYLAGK
jgi:ABC-type sulfate transport system substrate-binding protein